MNINKKSTDINEEIKLTFEEEFKRQYNFSKEVKEILGDEEIYTY